MTAPDIDTLPLVVIRAQKIAALLALAHQAEVPISSHMSLTTHDTQADLYFCSDPEEYDAWAEWLNPTESSSDDYVTATVTVELADLGPVTVEWFSSIA